MMDILLMPALSVVIKYQMKKKSLNSNVVIKHHKI